MWATTRLQSKERAMDVRVWDSVLALRPGDFSVGEHRCLSRSILAVLCLCVCVCVSAFVCVCVCVSVCVNVTNDTNVSA